jgi:predicted methyltransferase
MRHPSLAALLLASLAACASGPAADAVPEPSASATAEAPSATSSSGAPTTTASALASAVPAPPRRQMVAFRTTPESVAVVAAKDRAEDDLKLDAGRKPAELLSFFGVGKGMKVAELGAGGGYSAELFARAVGPTGKVYGQNSKLLLERFAEKPWSERLKKPVMKDVVRVDREFDDPLPPDAKNLDAVFLIMFYHDTVWQKTDRAKMNAAIFAALKPGGLYGIIDHSGKPGTGVTEAESLHRIEESVLLKEVQAAGFIVERESDFLRNPDDALDWSTSPRNAGEKRGTSDRFAIVFKRPS